jgi:hypothetical protein
LGAKERTETAGRDLPGCASPSYPPGAAAARFSLHPASHVYLFGGLVRGLL